jgi:hypothetical protein
VSDVTPPEITSVNVLPTVLTAGQWQVTVTATVTDEVGVIGVAAVAINPYLLLPVSDYMELGLDAGTPQNGTWNGSVIIPTGNDDGDYHIQIIAADEDYNYVENDDLIVSVQRGPEVQPPPDGPSEITENGKCCCEVSINITAGPVNIYVCGPDSKLESNIPE